ncbi:uncharacterized protein LOC135199083 [Macrobrachium nipponense]|uniref:uncharacterized protein LOC135199083 n=1 Tax=Macrobrachium nipponense TaxID=159736 RepID=UPI0030C89AD2
MSVLVEQGVDSVFINVLRHIYDHAPSFIRLHKDSEPFQLKRGVVRKGDTRSPKLYTACPKRAFRQLNWREKGIRIDEEYLTHRLNLPRKLRPVSLQHFGARQRKRKESFGRKLAWAKFI